MTKKKKEEIKAVIHGECEKSVKAYDKYFRLSQLLFNEDSDECPYRMNDLKEDNVFYKDAKSLADELGIDWEKMTDEESNRIMLNLLGDSFMAIKPDDNTLRLHTEFTVSISEEKKTKGKGDSENGCGE